MFDAGPTIVRVALDLPIARLFDYRLAGEATPVSGARVLVPLGERTAVGIAVELTRSSSVPVAQLKRLIDVLDTEALLDDADFRLLRFASDYYHHPFGAVVMSTLPVQLRRAASSPGRAGVGYLVLTSRGAGIDLATVPKRAVTMRGLLERLRSGPLALAAVRAEFPRGARAIAELVARGWVGRHTEVQPVADPAAAPAASAPPHLTAEQAAAVAVICASRQFRTHLLLGVAGSGKTEVYLHAIAHALAQQRQALLLVPEIALTPQLESLVSARFPQAHPVSLHSGLTERERLERWQAARTGRARVVLGTRLAVFAPLPDLGIILVDEEHDASFKQSEGFRYSARDLAVVRGRQRDVPVVLGSATPALETYHNALAGRYALLPLRERIGAPPPAIQCVDTRGQRGGDGLAPELLAAIRQAHARGEQSLVFINRRGYAPVLTCRGCGWISGCHRCAAQLVLHLKDRRLRCHHCGHQASVPAACPGCGNQDLTPVGQGTQRVESALAAALAPARVLRIDRDSTRPRNAWPEMRRAIESRKVDVLVGTQILAKGHDFPHLNLVGVVNADSLLYSADIRAAERLFALLTQVAGRAGRARARGTVLIQTAFPGHPLYTALMRHDYRAFADTLLAERRRAGFPPFVYQALLRAEAPRLDTALEFLSAAEREARRLGPGITVYDPVPAALPRRAGRERAQLLVQSGSRRELQRFLRAWHETLSARRSARARWSLDVDPLEF
ncbi:MAG: primosomal protein N' [Burkholderiales bacterium]|nr:primosomal protein N' [Burkholderiales bacterium]